MRVLTSWERGQGLPILAQTPGETPPSGSAPLSALVQGHLGKHSQQDHFPASLQCEETGQKKLGHDGVFQA